MHMYVCKCVMHLYAFMRAVLSIIVTDLSFTIHFISIFFSLVCVLQLKAHDVRRAGGLDFR